MGSKHRRRGDRQPTLPRRPSGPPPLRESTGREAVRAGPRARDPWRRAGPALVVGAVLAAYHNSLALPFIFDDAGLVEDTALMQLWPPRMLLGTTRPLVQLSFAVNHALGGPEVAGYHAVNLAIHVLAALVLFGIVRRTLATAPLAAEWGRSSAALATVVAALWAVHPLQTESVTYVSQRAESLTGLFYLLTLYAVVRGATSPAHSGRWYVAAVVACACGMASKPVMVTAPLAIALYDRVFLAGSWRRAFASRAGLYVGLAATWAILVLVLSSHHESAATAGLGLEAVTPLAYLRSQPAVVLHYLGLALWPRRLVLDYGWPVAAGGAAVVLPSLVVALLLALVVIAVRRRPTLGILGALFFLTLAPSSSIVPIQDLAFEHRMYLPLAPLVALAVVGANMALRRLVPQASARTPSAIGLAAVVIGALCIRTVVRNEDYRSEIGMWTDVVRWRPANSRAHSNLSAGLFDGGRIEEALSAAREAVRLAPGYADAYGNLGRAAAELGRDEEAIVAYGEALRLHPENPEAHNNLGVLLSRRGEHAQALAHYDEAVRQRPAYAEAHNNAGVALARRQEYEAAKERYARALALRPGYAEARANLGNVLFREGALAEAAREYRTVLSVDPSLAEVHYNLALVLAAQDRGEEAAVHRAEALRLRPELGARGNLP